MALVWYAALGGGLGSAARFLLTRALQVEGVGLPVGTLTVNVVGSFAIGLLLRHSAADAFDEPMRALLVAGFCGGFTTFSAFSAETLVMLQRGDWRAAALNVALSIALCIGAAAAGFAAGSFLPRGRPAP